MLKTFLDDCKQYADAPPGPAPQGARIHFPPLCYATAWLSQTKIL